MYGLAQTTMVKTKKQRYSGIVYSTDDSFEYQEEFDALPTETPDNEKQRLTVQLDKKARKGKMVTLVRGFVGTDADLESLARQLKQQCAVGGSIKDGEIIIQGDFRERIREVLVRDRYKVKVVG